MGSQRHKADARPGRLPWPPAVRAILWLDAVLLFAGALALGGMVPVLEAASGWTWFALAGSTLTAASAALAAFELSRNPAWIWLPVPALVLWAGASGLGCVALPAGPEVWGDTVAEAGECLKFLLAIAAPLLALILFMLWRVSPLMPRRVMALGGLASAGASASVLSLVHPHDAPLLDLGAHAIAIALLLAASAVVARQRSAR